MVLGIIDEPVVGVYDALRPAGGGVQRVDVALAVFASRRVRQPSFIVSKPVSADAFAVGAVIQTAAAPAESAGVRFGDKVLRQTAVEIQIERNIFGGGILSVFAESDGGRLIRRIRRDGFCPGGRRGVRRENGVRRGRCGAGESVRR